MGRVIMEGGKKKLFLGGFLFIMFIHNSCGTKPYPIDYQLLDTGGKYRPTVKRDIIAYETLINKGFVSNIDFGRFDNNRYFELEMDLYTLQKYSTLKIHSLEFEFEEEKKIVELNKIIKLNFDYSFSEHLFIVEDNDGLSVMAYNTLIEYFISNIKIDLHKIFNRKDEDIGKRIELSLRTNYSFDKGDIVTQENKYLVSITKTMPVKTDFAYRFSVWKGRFDMRRNRGVNL